ncbi:3TM-type holin [Sphingomonas sp.]|uniref:3TM-type holin n=1 Tax=Sphingomonas sp. TaxID=28214 RepID=UPI0035C794C1
MPTIAPLVDGLVAPLAQLLDRIIPDPQTRDAAKRELLRLERTHELDAVRAQIAALIAEASAADPWVARARPTFLYVIYALLLWSVPVGLIAAVRPAAAQAIARGMTAYLNALPEPLYALFGTGYLGYTVAREWGKRAR